jgi:hypothetical protein
MKTYEVEFYIKERRIVKICAFSGKEAMEKVREGEYSFYHSEETETLIEGLRVLLDSGDITWEEIE